MIAYMRFVFEQNFCIGKICGKRVRSTWQDTESFFSKVLAAARYVCRTSWCRADLDTWRNLCASKEYSSRKIKEMTATEESNSLT